MRLGLRCGLVLLFAVCIAAPVLAQQPGGSIEPLFSELAPGVAVPFEVQAAFETLDDDPTTRDVRLVALRPPQEIRTLLQATAAQGDALIEFALNADLRVYLDGEEFVSTGETSYQWFASLLDQDRADLPGSAVIGGESDSMFGTVFLDGRQFEIHSVSTEFAAVREIEENAFPPEHSPDFTPERRSDASDGQGGDAPREDEAKTARIYTIRVLVPYTSAAETKIRRRGYSSVSAFAQASVDNANLIYRNSRINVRLERGKVFKLGNYTETGNWNTDINKFFNHAGARQERDNDNADIAVLLFDNGTWCGEVQDIDAKFSTAFAVVWWNCSIGNMSFAHEIGHLQGAEHNEGDASNPPAFAYGHGYHYRARWRTVMAYPGVCGKCERLPYFSSPLIRHPTDRVPMGDAGKHDNARVLRETAARISGFQ